ncbi:TlpA disulfide reductase family protein [uncultured Gimesia sp.]|uniref:TlpA disulfide reductase family protein n=1 Tax=uncultured Gimesia sp. TaxID=1678688 RepID=UPI002625C3A9|nr:TlpA disulfide reductase family protein [uncultured Gimesia sp.]
MTQNFILISIMLCFLLSCQRGTPDTQESDPEPLSRPEAIISKLPPVQINLQEITPTGLKAEIEKHKGKVVLLDFWALWCPMCLESFHHLSEWHLKYAEQGLVIITISLDEDNPENQKKVIEYLQKQRAPFETFISREGPTKETMRAFKIDGGALPHCQVFNREGEHVISLGNYNPNQIYGEPTINAALEKEFSQP